MFGNVRYLCQVPWPPIDHDTPLFSITTCSIFVASAPLPAVSESPMAPITSISPGRNLWTDTGGVALRRPGPFGSQKNSWSDGNGFWTFCKIAENNFYIASIITAYMRNNRTTNPSIQIPFIGPLCIGSTDKIKYARSKKSICGPILV